MLHAALGGAPSNVALRSALGPLQRLAQKEKVPESVRRGTQAEAG